MIKKKIVKRLVIAVVLVIVIAAAAIFGLNAYVVHSTKSEITGKIVGRDHPISSNVIDELKEKKLDAVMVLGAQVRADGSVSYMLKDRLDVGIELYKKGAAPKLLLTGDHGRIRYDEVNAMKKYALSQGIPKEDLFLDHAGFSTYDSIYRAKAIFQVDKMVIATQTYHLHRALYGCNRIGIKAWGVGSDQKRYVGQDMRDLREIAARDKDFFKWMFQPEPTYLGDTIPINGSGIKSQD